MFLRLVVAAHINTVLHRNPVGRVRAQTNKARKYTQQSTAGVSSGNKKKRMCVPEEMCMCENWIVSNQWQLSS